MRVIIAGGRDYQPSLLDLLAVVELLASQGTTEIVSGAARGADTWGESVACAAGLPVRRFPADWDQYGKAAGFIRNEEMAKYADALIAMPGGRGTANMVALAIQYGIAWFNLDHQPDVREED